MREDFARELSPLIKKQRLEKLEKLGFKNKKALEYLSKFTTERIEQKIEQLDKLGVDDPVKIIEDYPFVAAFKIEERVKRLRDLGLDPVSLIQTYPKILSLLTITKVSRIINYLKDLGFKKYLLMIELYPRQIIDGDRLKILLSQKRALEKLGFTQPIKIIEFYLTSKNQFVINLKKVKKVIKILKKIGINNPQVVIERSPLNIYVPVEEKISDMKKAGFKNLARVIWINPRILGVNLNNVVERFSKLGFQDPISLIEKEPRLSSINIEDKLKLFREIGFPDPVKLITRYPELATRATQQAIEKLRQLNIPDPYKIILKNPYIIIFYNRLEKVIEALRKIGVDDPLEVITKDFQLKILKNYSRIESSVDELKKLGFSDPAKLIKLYPGIIVVNIGEICAKLKSYGFNDPIKMITRFPQLSGLNLERVINNFKELGFEDPIRILETDPTLSGFSQQTLRKKIKFLKRLDVRFNLNLFADGKLKEESLFYFTYNRLRIIFFLRIALYFNSLQDFKKIILWNPFIAYYFLTSNEYQVNNISDLKYLVEKYRRFSTKEDRKKLVSNVQKKLVDDFEKIKNDLLKNPQDSKLNFFLKLNLILGKLMGNLNASKD